MKKFHLFVLVPLLALSLVLIQSLATTKGRASLNRTGSKQPLQSLRGPASFASAPISVHAQGKGNPWINLRDGHDLVTDYAGSVSGSPAFHESELGQIVAQSQPLSLASGDFDEDGVPDLISGFAVSGNKGLLTLHRGNVDAIYPNTAEAEQRKAAGEFTDAPFLSPAQVIEAPATPSFIGTGDFDADGHYDVVMATRGSNKLYWMTGDGRGGFSSSQEIELPGPVTTLVTGEINRADGLADVVVGVADVTQTVSLRSQGGTTVDITQPVNSQSQNNSLRYAVLVFEGPEGALQHEPESIALPAAATALALGQLDDSYEMDLAVAAGSELVAVHGRDRKLSLDAESRAEVGPANIARETLPFAITSLVLGDFAGDYRAEIALLSADGVVHVLKRAEKDEPWGKIVSEVATGTRSETEAVTNVGSENENANATTAGRMPALPALVRARVSVSGKDDLVVVDRGHHQLHIVSQDVQGTDFSRAFTDSKKNPTEVGTLNLVASLAVDAEPVAMLPMRLNKDALTDLVVLKTGGASPLTVSATSALATFTVNRTGNEEDANQTDDICDVDLTTPGGQCTLRAAISTANRTPGLDEINFTVSSISVPAGSSLGQINKPVTIDGGLGRVEIIGGGIFCDFAACTIRNLVINRASLGILLNSGNNFIEGNYIGTDVSGTNAAFGSTPRWTGIAIFGANNMIGGTTLPARNVISTPETGVQIFLSGSTLGTKVQGNYIGTDASGTKALGSLNGVTAGNNSVIGGTDPRAGNVISGHSGSGVRISGPGVLVQGNLIGTNSDGTAVVTGTPTQFGVAIVGGGTPPTSATVGGTTPAARNIISGVSRDGVFMNDVSLILVQGNYIGIDSSGTKSLPNQICVKIDDNAPQNTIGGTTSDAGNVIAGGAVFGALIRITGSGNSVVGNYIGTDKNGTAALGTQSEGLFVSGNNNKIGGTEAGARNIIAFSSNEGVRIAGGAGNAVRRNSIFGNRLGITSNTGGPTLTTPGGLIRATLSGAMPNTAFTVEFFSNPTCDPNAPGSTNNGKNYLGDVTKTTDASGNATFDGPVGQNVSATASASGVNTSFFSNCVAGAAPTPTPTPTPTPAQINLNPTQLSFNANEGGANPQNQTVTLKNTGGSTLNWQAIATSTGNWLSVTGGSPTLAPNQSTTLTVSVNVSGLSGSTAPYQGTIAVTSANASNSPQTVNVTFNVATVSDRIKIVPGTERVNNATLDKVVLKDRFNVVFSCDVEYQLNDAFGSILLEVFDDSRGFGDRTLLKKEIFGPVSKSADPKTKHLEIKFLIPEVIFQKHFPFIEIEVTLLNSINVAVARSLDGPVAVSPREWLVIKDAKANNERVYASAFADRGVPTPNQNDKINLVLSIQYRMPDGGFAQVSVQNSRYFFNDFPVPLAATTSLDYKSETLSVPIDVSLFRPGVFFRNTPYLDFNILVSLNPQSGPTIVVQQFFFKFREEPNDCRFNLSRNCPRLNASSATAILAAKFNFPGSGESTSADPELTDLIAPGTSTPNNFATDTIDGASATVLKFPTNNGLALSPTTGVISNNVYSLAMLLKFDEANKRRRILDFKNGTSDNGLYADADNNLRFANVATGSGGPITANKYVQIVITRDAAGVVTGYVDDVQQFQFTDTGNLAVIDSNNTLRFFQDNTSGSGTGEASAGSIARLRLYRPAFSAQDIAGLDREPSSVEFSAANYSVSESGGSATITVTRTGATSLPATVDYLTSDETAQQPVDYTIASGTLSFAAGETSKTFQVQVTNNGLVDLDREVVLFLQNPNNVTLDAQSVAVLTIADNDTAQAGPTWEAVALTTSQVEIKTWTVGGRTYAYLKLLFPNAGYRVTNWGQAVRAGNDFTADAALERFTGPSVEAVTTTAQIYDLGTLSPGSYNFTFKNTGTVVKTQPFTVAAPPFPANSIDDQRQFVRQQYLDFLNREPDGPGWDFWTDNITKCMDPARRPAGQTEAECTLRQRETTSGAFFLSPEFQYTGYYVYRMYQGALGRQPKLSEFIPDAQFVGAGILVNSQLSAAKINQNKADYAAQFVNCVDPAKYRCAEFKAIYDGLNSQQYVDKLFQTTGVNASAADRTALVNGLNGGTETRASVLQKVVDGVIVLGEGNQQFTTSYGQAFYNSEFNRAFVQLQYFGYMKRDPDEGGYAFWLGKLNQFGGNFVNAEMVLAFISSPEYRARFGQP